MTNKPEIVNEKDLIERKDGLTYKKYARVPFTGVVNTSGGSKTKTYYGLDMRMHYEKGVKTVVEWFHNNGELKSRENYKDGKRDGFCEIFYENGQLQEKGNYKTGKRDGLWERFYEHETNPLILRSHLYERVNYKNGKAEGLFEVFHKDGHLVSKGDLKNDELHGLQEWFYKNGQVFIKRNYKNGEIHGLYEEYFENGHLKQKGNYKNTWGNEVRIGEHKYFYKNGELELIERFKRNGKRAGQVKGFYENGKPAFTEFYKNRREWGEAVQHGEWVSYSQEGHICIRNKYMNGEIRSYEKFDATGKLEQKINYAKKTTYGFKNTFLNPTDFLHMYSIDIYDGYNNLNYDSEQLNNDIVFRHARRELLHAIESYGYVDHGLIEFTDLIPQRIRNDEEIAWAVNPRALHYTWYPTLIEYLGDKLKSDKDFIEDYYDSIRSTLIGEHDFVIKGNNSPIKWNEPDRYSKNEAVRFLSIILELRAMDKRLINRPFKNWIKKTFKKHVSKEFFESLNDQPTKDGELIE